nr:RecName: Full=22 kDa cell wall protein [Solanum lycopersicum]
KSTDFDYNNKKANYD